MRVRGSWFVKLTMRAHHENGGFTQRLRRCFRPPILILSPPILILSLTKDEPDEGRTPVLWAQRECINTPSLHTPTHGTVS